MMPAIRCRRQFAEFHRAPGRLISVDVFALVHLSVQSGSIPIQPRREDIFFCVCLILIEEHTSPTEILNKKATDIYGTIFLMQIIATLRLQSHQLRLDLETSNDGDDRRWPSK